MTTDLKTSQLELKMTQIAEVMAAHKVFGVVAEDASEQDKADLQRWIDHEKQHVVGMALRHALDPRALASLKLNYKDTGAVFEMDNRVAFNTAIITFVKVVPVLIPNPTLEIDPKIDYEALKTEIEQILAQQ